MIIDGMTEFDEKHWFFVGVIWPPVALIGTMAILNMIEKGRPF